MSFNVVDINEVYAGELTLGFIFTCRESVRTSTGVGGGVVVDVGLNSISPSGIALTP